MKQIFNVMFFVCIILSLVSCAKYDSCSKVKAINLKNEYAPVTIFVHGTLPPYFNLLIHGFDSPLGLIPATYQGNKLLHGRIGYTLSSSNSDMFPLDSFYIYGWKGKLSFEYRYKVARELYQKLKQFKGPITLIGHSHGGNVILNIAKIARSLDEESIDKQKINIDKIILLAVPAQEETKSYTKSPIFKKVYSFYSTGDRTQVQDPQALYRELRNRIFSLPLCSGRFFDPHPNLKQIRVLLYKRNAQHLDFIYSPFLSRLAEAINIVDSVDLYDPKIEYVINIPFRGKAMLMKKNRKNSCNP